jgi:hypothetical protein
MNTNDMLMPSRNNQIGETVLQLWLGQSPDEPKRATTWFIRPIFIAIVLLQVLRFVRAVRRLPEWQRRLRRTPGLSKQLVRHSAIALAIDVVVFSFVFVVPRSQVGVP